MTKKRLSPMVVRRLIEARNATGHNKTEVAKRIGADSSYLTRLEKGECVPSVTLSLALAQTYGVSVDWLFTEEPSPIGEMQPASPGSIDAYAARIATQLIQQSYQLAALNGNRLNFHEILGWWRSTGGQLSGSDVETQFDCIEIPEPTDTTVVPYAVGPRSLAGIHVGKTERLARIVNEMDLQSREDLVMAYSKANQNDPGNVPISQEDVELHSAEMGASILLKYHRILLPITGADGRKMIMSHCYPVQIDRIDIPDRAAP